MAATTDVGKPRFKQELVAEPIDENGAKFIDVMDPDSGNVFRFFEVEYALACAMDGERDVPGIVKWAQEELGLTPSTNEVRTVIRTLGGLGYLDDGARTDTRPAQAAAEAARPIVVETARPVVEPVQPARPTPVAAVAAADPALARGVVVGQPHHTAGAAEIELGVSGASTSARAVETLPAAPDIGLGKSGASTAPAAVVEPGEQFALGHSGPGASTAAASGSAIPSAGDMSLDLSDNMKIQLDDVKEAVRASKVITAVEVPKDLLDMLEASEKKAVAETAKPGASTVEVQAEAKVAKADKKPEPKVEAQPEPKVEPKVEAKPEPKVEAKADKKPDAKVDAKADAKADKKPVDAKADAKADVKDKKPETKADAKSDKKPDAKADVKVDKKPDAKLDAKTDKKPVEDKKPIPPAPSGTSPVLIAVLVLVLLGAGAFFVWKFVLSKPAEGDGKTMGMLPGSAAPTPGSAAELGSAGTVAAGSGAAVAAGSAGSAAEGSAAVMPGSGAALEATPTKLAAESPAPYEHKPAGPVTVEWLEANDKVVKTGDVVARFVGSAKAQATLNALTNELKGLPAIVAKAKVDLEALQAAGGDEAAIATAKNFVDDRESSLKTRKPNDIAKAKTELARYMLFAKADGKITAVAKVNDKLTATQTVVTIAREPVLVATFKKDPLPAIGDALALIHKASGKTIDCTVAEAKDGVVKVNCPNDPLAAFKADDEVTLK